MNLTIAEFASMIEHTRVAGTDNIFDVKEACKQAIKNNFAAVCVNPFYVENARDILYGSKVEVCTGIGYPLGANLLETKVNELRKVVSLGADAVDFVINYGALKSGDWNLIAKEISTLVNESGNAITKLIIETCYLNKDEIFKVSELAANTGVQYVKTSTGMGTAGAEIEDVKLIHEAINGKCKIKAAGGIKTIEQAFALIEAGASRLGTSSGVYLVNEYRLQKKELVK